MGGRLRGENTIQMEGGQAVSLEEQLRYDAQSLREVGWFNRAIMMDAAANEIQKLNERIKRLESVENSHAAVLKAIDEWMQQHKAKETKP